MVLCHWCKQEKPLKINVLIIFWLIFTWNLVIRVWWIWIKRVGLFPHTIHVFWWLIWRGGIVPQPHTVNHCVIWGAGTCRSLSFKYFGAELNLRAIADSCLYRKGITEVWLYLSEVKGQGSPTEEKPRRFARGSPKRTLCCCCHHRLWRKKTIKQPSQSKCKSRWSTVVLFS